MGPYDKRKGKTMEKIFKLKENGTTVRTEILAGLTTFMTMAYIIALNPNLLTGFAVGTPLWNGVFLATCMAFLANKPFAMAPGMGLNSFFAVVVANIAVINDCDYTSAFQAALVIILIEGIVFLVLTVLKVREKIVEAIPLGVRYGIAPALTPSIIKGNMGSGYDTMVLTVVTAFLGVFVMVVLAKKGIKAAVLLGMLFSSVLYWIGSFAFLGVNPFASLETASFVPPFADMVSTTLFKFDFAGFMNIGWFTAITLIITFCMIDMFDTIGTLVGTASRAGMVNEKGEMPNMKEALLSDAIGTVAGAATGTSTVTTFIESASGVEAGGRTGLTALTSAVLFLACIFLAPVAAIIPGAATSAALIYVGVLMLQGLKNVNFDDMDQMLPVSIMLIGMPISGSIGHAIGLGLISYAVVKLLSGKAKDVSVLTYVISVLFLIKFFAVV